MGVDANEFVRSRPGDEIEEIVELCGSEARETFWAFGIVP